MKFFIDIYFFVFYIGQFNEGKNLVKSNVKRFSFV